MGKPSPPDRTADRKVALVTVASGTIGAAIAELRQARASALPCIIVREKSADELVEGMPPQAEAEG